MRTDTLREKQLLCSQLTKDFISAIDRKEDFEQVVKPISERLLEERSALTQLLKQDLK